MEFVFTAFVDARRRTLSCLAATHSGRPDRARHRPASGAWVAGRISAASSPRRHFARRIADGDLTARIETAADDEDELSAMEAALNQTAERLGRTLPNSKAAATNWPSCSTPCRRRSSPSPRRLCALVQRRHAAHRRIAAHSRPPARPLVRDPELLACVRGALERRELCVGRASLLAPGRVFEVNAAPLPAGGALSCSTTSPASRPRKNPAASSSPTSATSCARRSLPSRATSRPSSKIPTPARKPRSNSSASFSKTPAA
jgi:HAMP domain-containing protein